MKSFFSNIWVKRFFAIVGALYTLMVCMLCYNSIFYNIEIEQKVTVCMAVTGISVLALVIMLYARKQILTRLSSFLILPLMLPVVLLYFGEWEIIIPIIVTGIMILLLSGAGEGAKTAFGTIILLMYIFGALGYFLFTSFFVSSAKQTVVSSGVSQSGMYRYRIVNTEDTSNGSTAVYVEPNDADKIYPMVKFTPKNIERIVALQRPICENLDIQWTQETRQQITDELNAISDDIRITLTEEELCELGHSADSRLQLSDIDIYDLLAIGKTAKDVDPIKLDTLSEEALSYFKIGKDSSGRYYALEPTDELIADLGVSAGERIYLADLNSKQRGLFDKCRVNDYGYTLSTLGKDNTVPLNSLTDAQLASLGVGESGDVMTFNGKICFRYYVAQIEDYFDTENRKFSMDLFG